MNITTKTLTINNRLIKNGKVRVYSLNANYNDKSLGTTIANCYNNNSHNCTPKKKKINYKK